MREDVGRHIALRLYLEAVVADLARGLREVARRAEPGASALLLAETELPQYPLRLIF